MKIIKSLDGKVNKKINNSFIETGNSFKVEKIKQISKIVTGNTPSLKNQKNWSNKNGIKWFSIPNFRLVKNGFLVSNERFLTNDGAKVSRVCPAGTVLVSCIATVGEVAILKESSAFNQQINGILPSKKINSMYLRYVFMYQKNNLIKYAPKNVIMNINKSLFEDYEISYIEDIEQQEKISYILSVQENQIETIRELIKKIETRNQYYAEKILSGELRVRKNEDGNIEFYNNTEWQEDSLKSLFFSKEYSVPKGWKIKPILDNIKLIKGISINSSEFNYQGMGRQFLRTGDVWEDASSKKEPAFFDGVVDDKFIKTENDYVSCFEGFNKEIGNGTIGLVTNLGEGIISSHLYKTENKNIDGKYYSASLLKTDYIQNILIRNAVGSTVLSSTKCLKDILFIFPDNDEMILIEEVLSSLYLESNNLRKVLEKEKLRFQWLLDNLLSGEYQVVDE